MKCYPINECLPGREIARALITEILSTRLIKLRRFTLRAAALRSAEIVRFLVKLYQRESFLRERSQQVWMATLLSEAR